ncbi:hypothetical protein BG015_002975 [Linnemannia schmuckeri]|uniref:Uncharacterized protein n=1 Tax=Linnemannia schmuckeri TaxID=64567 RepID=A0A9P5RQK9_9FUNG|nr:hypothetical protein BG015_002975 [Linnemannia schmuckeri]
MVRFRTQMKHLLIVLGLFYFISIWLLSHSSKKPSHHHRSSSKARILPRDADESLTKFIRKLPLKDRFEIERRHISYNLRLGQRDEYDSAKCGSWPVHYLRTKQQQQQQGRFIVHSCAKGENCGQISDRLMSAASLFMVSLLTDREFFVDWEEYPLFSVFRTPFLNLQAPSATTDVKIEGESRDEQQQEQRPLSLSMSNWEAEDLDLVFGIRSLSTYLDTKTRTRSGHQSARKMHDQLVVTPQVRIHTNRGLVQRIMTDTSFSDRLESMGLHQHNAYECILSFLFRPTWTTQELIHQYRAVFKTPGVTTIGIHLPSGDADRRFTLREYEHSMPCAQNLSREIRFRNRNPDERVLYVIFTDSIQIRNKIQKEYGDKLNLIFPPTPQQQQQLHLEKTLKKRAAGEEAYSPFDPTAPISAYDEDSNMLSSYLFSETDYQIITSSSFSKLALFRKGASGRRSAVLMPNKVEWALYRENHRSSSSRAGSETEGGGLNSSLLSTLPPVFQGIRLPDCSRMDDAITPWDKIASFGTLG